MKLIRRLLSGVGGLLRSDTTIARDIDLDMALRYGHDWYERAVWECECGDTWRINDMYNHGGVCPYCGNEPELISCDIDVPF